MRIPASGVFLVIAGAVVLILVAMFARTVSGTEFNFEGEEYCTERKAWPDGSWLGQFHPWHQQHYINVFGREAACAAWAKDQRNSAIVGLRKLGYRVDPPKTPVLKVDELTFRFTDNASGQVTLGEGCYAIWLDEPHRTPEQIIAVLHASAEERKELLDSHSRGRTVHHLQTRARLLDPDTKEPVGTPFTRHSNFAVVDPQDPDHHSKTRWADQDFDPGTYVWQVQTSWRLPNTEWELRFIPIDYTIPPWDTFWAAFPQGHSSEQECPVQ